MKASDDVPVELMEEYEIPTETVLYRGDKDHKDVAKHFVEAVVEVALKIEELMKTKLPMKTEKTDKND